MDDESLDRLRPDDKIESDVTAESEPTTDTIDLNNLFGSDVTSSGSFDLRGMRRTSLGRLLNTIPLPAILVDAHHTVVFANDACRNITPENEEVLGHPLSRLFSRDDYARQAESLIKRVLSDRKTLEAETIIGPEENRIWTRMRIRSLRVRKERLLLVMFEDLTLEKRHVLLNTKYSEGLRAARRQVEESVQERTQELLKINDQLRQVIKQREEMLEQGLERGSGHDPVSSMLTRDRFLELLESTYRIARRYGLPLSLAILDLDRFTAVADRFGRQASDEVLKKFGGILTEELRSSDLAGRYGEDEFIVAFPNTTASGAGVSMERIRSRTEQTVFESGTYTYSITCTGGIAELQTEIEDIEELIREAVSALQRAKSRGRNRIVVHRRDSMNGDSDGDSC